MTAQSFRFVILEHDHPFTHWDLMLEQEDSLRTWRLLSEPVLNQWIEAELLPNHRKDYLDYEGPVSGNRGNVTRWDFGTCLAIEDEEAKIRLTLDGSRVQAVLTLVRNSQVGESWQGRLSPID